MAKFIELHKTGDISVLINTDNIIWIQPKNINNTLIMCNETEMITVIETYDKVKELLRRANYLISEVNRYE